MSAATVLASEKKKDKEQPIFSPIQCKVLANAHARWNILSGATRSGKTHVSYFLAIQHIYEHLNDRVLFVGKTLATLNKNVFDPMREIFGDKFIGKVKADSTGTRTIKIFGKSCYCVGANDERAITKIQGSGVGYAYCDELTTFPENFFNMLKTRLDTPGALCDATCNPEAPGHFVKKFIDDPKNNLYNEHFTIYDNPFLPRGFVESLENELRGTVYFDRWILGNWVKAEGLVFPLFKREKHYLTPVDFRERYGRHFIRLVIWGADGANVNDATAIEPLAIMDNGQGVFLEPFYHSPKINGALSNEQLVPYIREYLRDMEERYRFRENGVQFYMPVDCAASDLILTLSYNLPEYFNVDKYTKKDLLQTTDTVNNAFSRNAIVVLNFGGYKNYFRGAFVPGERQLVTDLEAMTWKDDNRTFDGSIPNDTADAARYAICSYFYNPANLWDTPEVGTYTEVNS